MSHNSNPTQIHDKVRLHIAPWGKNSALPCLLATRGFLDIYPYKYNTNFSSEVTSKEFTAMVIENEYLRATVIPDLGCRLFSLYDKLASREVFCVPDPILPKPIALRGAYIPLGIEYNFPCGHSVHNSESIPCEFIEKEDGSKGIRMHVTNAVTGIVATLDLWLCNGERLLRSKLNFHNPLPVRNGFMYWANAAVRQTPDMTFQCKARMSHFFVGYNSYPIVDGLDIRIAKNRRFASDAFAVDAQDDWFGFYSPEKHYGALHLAQRSQMRGQKFFSWGFDEYGFDASHSMGVDEYGYMEFQAGILETQMEFLHLEPNSEYVCDEIWFPFHDFANISHATENLILSKENGKLRMTSARELSGLYVKVTSQNNETATTSITSIKPGQVIAINIPEDFAPENYHILVADKKGEILLEADIKDPLPASDAKIAQKQAWMDIQPNNPKNIVELAFRQYKARKFSQAEELAKKVQPADTPYFEEASKILWEIAWWRQNGLPDTLPADDSSHKIEDNPNTQRELQSLQKRLENDPDDAETLALLGNLYSWRNEAAASKYWHKAIKCDSKQWQASRNIGYFHLRNNHSIEALPFYRQAVKLKPDDIDLQTEFQYALRCSGYLEEALSLLNALPSELRDDYRLVKMKAYLLADLNLPDQALYILENPPQLQVWEGEVTHHKYYIDCLLNIGLDEISKQHYAAAEHAFRKMLYYPEKLKHAKPLVCNEAIAFYHLGLVAEALGNLSQAKGWWTVAINQDYPHQHHWISYRENEYYAALAAQRLGYDEKVPFIIDRLLMEHNIHSQEKESLDFPLFTYCWRSQLAAARGFLLKGEIENAAQALNNAEQKWGPSWIVSHTKKQFPTSYQNHGYQLNC